MLRGAEDSVLACLGSVAAAVTSALWWCAACIETLLAALDFVARTAVATLTFARAVWTHLFAVAAVVFELVGDACLLLGRLVQFVAFLLTGAFVCVQTVAHAVEQVAVALYGAAATAFDVALRAIDAPRVALREAALLASNVDVRAFESTSWLVVKLVDALLASASWLFRSAVAALSFVWALPRNTVVWIESLVELVLAGATGALGGACLAVATHASTALSKVLWAIGGLTEVACTWNSATDWLSKLIACVAVIMLIMMAVANMFQVALHQAPEGHRTSESSGEGTRNDDNQNETNAGSGDSRNTASAPHQPGMGSNTTSQDDRWRLHLASDGRRSRSSRDQSQRPAASDVPSEAAASERSSSRSDGCCESSDDGLGAFVRQLQKQLDAEKERQLCVICQHAPKTVLLLPCRHLCVCPACADKLGACRSSRERICPLCRSSIDDNMSVYT